MPEATISVVKIQVLMQLHQSQVFSPNSYVSKKRVLSKGHLSMPLKCDNQAKVYSKVFKMHCYNL
jgi:hypothetical protein